GRALRWLNADWQIVGVVGDMLVRRSGVSYPAMVTGPVDTPPIVYFPAAQMSESFAQLVHQWFSPYWSVRTVDGVDGQAILTRAITRVDPLLPITPPERLEDIQAAVTASERLLLILVSAFALVATVLVAI